MYIFSEQPRSVFLVAGTLQRRESARLCDRDLLVRARLVHPAPKLDNLWASGKIMKMDLWGNQFSCCVLNGGIEMKCRIIKKITSPPSHVIMRGFRGSGLCHSAGGKHLWFVWEGARLSALAHNVGWVWGRPCGTSRCGTYDRQAGHKQMWPSGDDGGWGS